MHQRVCSGLVRTLPPSVRSSTQWARYTPGATGVPSSRATRTGAIVLTTGHAGCRGCATAWPSACRNGARAAWLSVVGPV